MNSPTGFLVGLLHNKSRNPKCTPDYLPISPISNHVLCHLVGGHIGFLINTKLSTRKNCFRYLKLMSPLKNNYLTLRSHEGHYGMRHTAYLERQKRYGPDKLR